MPTDPPENSTPFANARRPLIVAHRAITPGGIENTGSAIQQAIQTGVDLVELDVRLSLDRRLVVLHDALLGRTTTGHGWVRLWPANLLCRLHLREASRSEHVPLLAQLLPLFPAETQPALHLKDRGALKPVLRLIDRLGMASGSWLWLSHAADVHQATRELPDLQVTLLRPSGWRPESRTAYFHDAQRTGAAGVSLPAGVLTRSLVDEAHEHGLRVFTRIDPGDDPLILADLGVDGLITTDPAAVTLRLAQDCSVIDVE